MRFRSVTSRHKEVGIDGKKLFDGNEIPHSELHNHRFYGLFFVPNVVFFQILDVLRVDIRNDAFNRQ